MPYTSFLAIHFEVGGHTRNLAYQRKYWPETVELIKMANQYNAKLTLQFNPQWAEYILKDGNKFNLIKEWQKQDHEIALHHHGCDHGDWNGYTNRDKMHADPKFIGPVKDMMKLMRRLAYPGRILCGTVTDEKFDYPRGIKYDTEGIKIFHARTKPKSVLLHDQKVTQAGMAFLSREEDIEKFKNEYLKSNDEEIFGVTTHEKDFAKNPALIEKWFHFIKSNDKEINNVSKIINAYQKIYSIEHNHNPLTFYKNVFCDNLKPD